MSPIRGWLALSIVTSLAGCAPTVPHSGSGVVLSNRYADPQDVHAGLRMLTAYTLARPQPARRLFVEGYFMRSLVAAAEVLPASGRTLGDTTQARGALAHAVAFADTLVATQDENGYWPIGYESGWVADMGAALGIFAAVEPHVSAQRLARYEGAAERFVQALQRDGLLLDSGAVGIGWPMGQKPKDVARAWRSDVGWNDDQYVVGTALAGIETQAWLYHRTGRPEYKDRALAAFTFTIAQLHDDGSVPTFAKQEGAYGAAAYVEEGWMAAAVWLTDPVVQARLAAALPRHVAWLLRTQRPDGTWDSGFRGDGARSVAIIEFLVWYDERFGRREDVRNAVRRAGHVLLESVRPSSSALYAEGPDAEVRRAHTGRPLAAILTGHASF